MNTASINITIEIDKVTLEYNDKIKLIFNPTSKDTIPDLEKHGEYIRNCSTVNIIDSNRKNTNNLLLQVVSSNYPFCSVRDIFRIPAIFIS